MADFFVPANLFQGRGAAESPGTGAAVGDGVSLNPVGLGGYDYTPNQSEPPPGGGGPVGGINHMSLGVLAREANGDSDKEQPAAFLEAFKRIGAGGGLARISVAGGDDVEIPQCAYAAPMASGSVFCLPSDKGSGPGQIPPVTSGWSAVNIAPHPSVFIRDASHCRGVVSQLDAGTDAAEIPQAIMCYTVDSPPFYSLWCLLIDGAPQTVLFPHIVGDGTIAGSTPIDVRRPRDIWSRVIVPEIQRRIAQAAPFQVLRDAGGGTLVSRGYISRLNYVSYARFIGYDSLTSVTPFLVA